MTPQELKAIRERYGLTQTQLANLLGRSIRTVQRWEGGQLEIEPMAQLAINDVIRHLEEPKGE